MTRWRLGLALAVALTTVVATAALGLERDSAASGEAEAQSAVALGDEESGDIQRENTAGLMREWAEDVVYAYLDAWSSENKAALTGVDYFYATHVTFFGRRVGRAAVRDDKLRFARRWPVRHYDHRPGTMKIACDVDTKLCHVRSILDYRAESPHRGARAEGSAEFELGISFAGARPVVVYETGRVLRTRSAST